MTGGREPRYPDLGLVHVPREDWGPPVRTTSAGLLFAPYYNKGPNSQRSDANLFVGGASRFRELHGEGWWTPEAPSWANPQAYNIHGRPAGVVYINNGYNAQTQEGDGRAEIERLRDVLAALRAYDGPPLSVIAFFCHGYNRGLQLGLLMGEAADGPRPRLTHEFLDVLATKAQPDLVFSMYACSTARARGGTIGDGSFADWIRDELSTRGMDRCRVDGHTEVANGVRSPHIVRFRGIGRRMRTSRAWGWIIAPPAPIGSNPADDQWSEWDRRIRRSDDDDFRYEYPFLSVEAIRSELERSAAEHAAASED